MAETVKFVIETKASAPIPRDNSILESFSPSQIMFRVEGEVDKEGFKKAWEAAMATAGLTPFKIEKDDSDKAKQERRDYFNKDGNDKDVLSPIDLNNIIVISFDNNGSGSQSKSDLDLEKIIENETADYRFLYRYTLKTSFSLVFVKLIKEFEEMVADVKRKDPVTYYVEMFNDKISNAGNPWEIPNLPIKYAMPIWRTRGTADEQHVGGGGPGSLPFPITEEDYAQETAKFRQKVRAPLPAGRKVRVYVLDTLYPKDWDTKVGGISEDKELQRSRDNVHPAKLNDATRRWWKDMIKNGRYIRANKIYTDHLGLDCNESCTLYDEFEKFKQYKDIPTYLLYDHGPFITDIIYRKAPEIEIFLVETLNGNATGDLITYAAVMKWLRNDIQKVIEEAKKTKEEYFFLVNCSFTFPLNAEVYGRDEKGEKLIQNQEALMRFGALLVEMLPISKTGFLDDILIIGAAGNDSLPWGEHSMPALPAVLPGVLGVGALSDHEDDLRAAYTNESDNDCELKISTDEEPVKGTSTSGGEMAEGKTSVSKLETKIQLMESILDTAAVKQDRKRDPLGTEGNSGPLHVPTFFIPPKIGIEELELFAFGGELEMEPLPGHLLKVRGGVVGPYLAVTPYASFSTGYAQWTGTSFATAYITADIVERLFELRNDKKDENDKNTKDHKKFRYDTPYAAAQSIAIGRKKEEEIDGVLTSEPSSPRSGPSINKGFLIPSGG